MLYKWFDTLKTHAVIYDIYIDTNEWFENSGVYLTPVMYNNRILNLVQALEAFHTIEYESEDESGEDFKKGLSDIFKLLNDEKDKKWIEDRTTPKRKTLRQRLTRLLDDYSIIMDEMFSDYTSKKKFITKLSELRNKLSHARHQSTDLNSDTQEYYFKAKLLLVACILKKLGFDIGQIKNTLESSRQYGSTYEFYKRLAVKIKNGIQ